MSVRNKYRILQCLYWMSGCVAWGYLVSYLAAYSWSATACGFLAGGFAFGAAVLQPLLGRIADRSSRFHWKNLLLLMAGAAELVLILLLFLKSPVLVGLLFGVYSMLVTALLSMVNVTCFYYEHQGISMNFGVARGLGSLAYAVLSFILGRLIAPFGIRIIILAGIAVMTAMILVTLSFPLDKATPQRGVAEEKSVRSRKTGFLRKYPAFFLMVVAVACFLMFHDMYTNYLLYILEAVGGDNASLGTALSIAALAELPVMFLSERLVKRFTSKWLLTFAGAVLVLRGVLYCMAGSVTAILLIQLLQIFTFAVIASIMVYFADECMEPCDQATGQSFMGMTMAVGNTVAYLLGGIVIDRFGITHMLIMGTIVSVAGTVIAFVSARMLSGRRAVRE